jgi:hypothetical protein
MESMLIAVTLLSLAMTVAMASVAWRLLRQERRRSAARVVALAALADRESVPSDSAGPVAEADAPAPDGPAHPARIPVDLPLRRASRTMNGLPPGERSSGGGEIFSAGLQPRGRNVRPIVFASVGFVMALTVLTAWYAGSRADDVGPTVPLELVSLGHDRQDDSLRITGLVQNPREGKEMRDVVAVAFLFDRDGTFITSGRAGLDFVRLAPGDESPFVIVIPNAGDVARYRLGFRTRDGHVLTHVDRRFETSAIHRAGDPAPGSALAAGGRLAVTQGRD